MSASDIKLKSENSVASARDAAFLFAAQWERLQTTESPVEAHKEMLAMIAEYEEENAT